MAPPRQTHFQYSLKSLFGRSPLRGDERKGRRYTSLQDRVYVGEERFIDLASSRVCVTEKGEGDPLILIHGLGAHIGRWEQTIEDLSKDFRVIAFDLPGFGKSQKGHKSYSVRFFTETLRELIEALGYKKVTLIGHSLGGAVVLRTLIEDASRVCRASVVAPAGIRLPQHRILRTIASIALRSPFARDMLARSLERCALQRTEAVLDMIYHAKHLPDDPEWKQIRHSLQNCAQNMMHFSVYGELAVIRTPLQVVWGEEDTLLPADLALLIHKEVPLARLSIIPECGHYPMLEKPEVYHQQLREFLSAKEFIEGCEH